MNKQHNKGETMNAVSKSEELIKAEQVFESRPMDDDQITKVTQIKNAATYLQMQLDSIEAVPESGRLIALAKTSLEESVMWATKAVSRQFQATP